MKTASKTHRCPIPGCERRVSNQYLLCPGHWRIIRDVALRRKLVAAFGRFNEDHSYPAFEALRIAQQETIDYVEAVLAQDQSNQEATS